jgi:hypothetical protein
MFLPHVSSIFKKISPKSFGPQCVCSSSAESPLLSVVYSRRFYKPHSLNCCDLTVQFLLSRGLIYCLLHASNLFRCFSQCCVSLEYSISFSHSKVLAALTLEASRVVTLLEGRCFPLLKYNSPRNNHLYIFNQN